MFYMTSILQRTEGRLLKSLFRRQWRRNGWRIGVWACGRLSLFPFLILLLQPKPAIEKISGCPGANGPRDTLCSTGFSLLSVMLMYSNMKTLKFPGLGFEPLRNCSGNQPTHLAQKLSTVAVTVGDLETRFSSRLRMELRAACEED